MLLLGLAMLVAPKLTFASLVDETISLDRLYRPLAYTGGQNSSYDRASVSSTEALSWFANDDAGKFLRTENVDGRTEFVMADLVGPGAVTRIWSANPAGRIRFYFDGETRASYTEKLADLLGGKAAAFPYPWAYEAARGWNLYAPIPYGKSLKITLDNSDGDHAKSVYYHVGYRTYPADTAVETFAASNVNSGQMAKVGQQMLFAPPSKGSGINQTFLLGGKGSKTFGELNGEGVVSEFRVQILEMNHRLLSETPKAEELDDLHQALRNLVLEAKFDGQKTISVPLVDLFLCAGGVNAYQTFAMAASEDGMFTLRLPMPFRKSARFQLVNQGENRFTVNTFLTVRNLERGTPPYVLHAHWKHTGGSTRPMRDLDCLHLDTEGVLVGSSMHIANPTTAWWGEGDEKITLDGSAFPDFFGTGTEDFYGYAWCDPTPFAMPFHTQPRVDGPGNKGHTQVARWFISDPIPFKRSIRFDIEMWHWQVVEADFDRVTMWYAPAKAVSPVKAEELILRRIERPRKIQGAVEGENLRVILQKGGTVEKQGGFPELSGGRQLWWRDAAEAGVLELAVDAPTPGVYEVSGHFCFASDYGRHQLSLNGKMLGLLDFYDKDLAWRTLTLGKVELRAGENVLRIENRGRNSVAKPGQMFGLDYLVIVPK